MVKTEKVHKDKGTEFIVKKSELIVDPDTQEEFVTITINKKVLHFIFDGLGKFKEGTRGEGITSKEERDKATQLISEFDEVKNIFNKEVIDTKIGTQEPNPTEDNGSNPI